MDITPTGVESKSPTEAPTGMEAETPKEGGSLYSIVAEATGETTNVDCSELVINEYVTGYQVTTSKDGKIVS